jgi:hypothetical protein
MLEPVTLFRPVGQAELDLIEASGWKEFPPRLPGQPIFYPVVQQGYAEDIAEKWNLKDPASGNVGYVTRFSVDAAFLGRYQEQTLYGGYKEYWIPAEDLEEFNRHIIGLIELIKEFKRPAPPDSL